MKGKLNINIDFDAIKRYILENKKKSLKIAGLAAVLTIALVTYLSGNLTKDEGITVVEALGNEIPVEEPESVRQEEKETIIVVDIQGAVKNSGIVYLPDGSRVNDAVNEAGGLNGDADTMNVNLAAKLTDGDKVYIPRKDEQKSETGNNAKPAGIVTDTVSNGASITSSAPANSESSLININTATSEQLQALSGVGPATAQKIIDYRESAGGFKKIEDIMKVSGIGTKTFEKFKDKIIV
jgi:competence protein ComEA